MRFGVVLRPGDGDPLARARIAEEVGIDLVWLEESPGGFAAPFVASAALAARTSVLRVVAAVDAGPHPVYLAEDAAVADQALNGRLVVAVGHVDADLLGETVDVLLAAAAPRPFLHEGGRWRIPANLPGNDIVEQKVRVTPTPAQIELPIWLTGPGGPPAARERALAHVSRDGADAAAEWAATEARLGRAAARLRRPQLRTVNVNDDGALDDDALVEDLRREQRLWGLDTAILELPPLSDAAYSAAVRAVAAHVRPRVQLDELPHGLEDYWRRRRAEGTL